MEFFLQNTNIQDSIKNNLTQLHKQSLILLDELEKASCDIEIKHNIKPKLLGKDGVITQMMSFIKTIDIEIKKQYAQTLNELKNDIEARVNAKNDEIIMKKLHEKLKTEGIDETTPCGNIKTGSLHVITKTSLEIIKILNKFGFELFDGPEIDSCENNFTKLNISENHPARQMHDTFYIKNKQNEQNPNYILRTHTSNIQIHTLQSNKPPIRGMSFGKTFRFDSDSTHSPMFHQMECFCVDENITMANLNFIINAMLSEFFETKINVRFRSSFFPFTNPSAEVDISYIKQENKIKIAKSDNFLEIGGCGMIHDEVLKNCGIDSQKYQGFAFGFGVDRMAMLKYGLPDIRKFYSPTNLWISQNNFNHFNI